MKTIFLLVIFLKAADGNPFPAIMEEPFNSSLECWNVGFSMKARDPTRIISFNCERMEIKDG